MRGVAAQVDVAELQPVRGGSEKLAERARGKVVVSLGKDEVESGEDKTKKKKRRTRRVVGRISTEALDQVRAVDRRVLVGAVVADTPATSKRSR